MVPTYRIGLGTYLSTELPNNHEPCSRADAGRRQQEADPHTELWEVVTTLSVRLKGKTSLPLGSLERGGYIRGDDFAAEDLCGGHGEGGRQQPKAAGLWGALQDTPSPPQPYPAAHVGAKLSVATTAQALPHPGGLVCCACPSPAFFTALRPRRAGCGSARWPLLSCAVPALLPRVPWLCAEAVWARGRESRHCGGLCALRGSTQIAGHVFNKIASQHVDNFSMLWPEVAGSYYGTLQILLRVKGFLFSGFYPSEGYPLSKQWC